MVGTKKTISEPKPPPGAIQWRNKGGTFRMRNNKIIKPNQTFWATESEVPQGFRDIIIPLNPIPEVPEMEVVASGYHIREKSPGQFDILDGRGKVVNEKLMTAEEAKAVLAKLS